MIKKWNFAFYSETERERVASEAYELLALLMRYIFVLIGAIIVIRAYRWLRRDAKAYKREMRALPDAGLVGEIVNLRTGESQPLPYEGVIGSARGCDIRLKAPGVARRHAMFIFEPGKGLRIAPCRGKRLLMEGVELRGAAHALHGTQIQIGGEPLRVRLFAGLNVPHPAQFQQEAPEEEGDELLSNPFASVPVYDGEEGEEAAPAPFQEEPLYAGDYTDDGQMTWDYAYSLEELHRAQAAQQAQQPAPEQAEEEEGEGLPYQSPLRRRRRNRR